MSDLFDTNIKRKVYVVLTRKDNIVKLTAYTKTKQIKNNVTEYETRKLAQKQTKHIVNKILTIAKQYDADFSDIVCSDSMERYTITIDMTK